VVPPLNESRMEINNVSCGSTLVSFTITPGTADEPTPLNILKQLTIQLNTPGSPLLSGSITSTSKVQNLTASAVVITLTLCSNGQWLPADQCPPTSSDSGTGVDKRLALGLGLGFGIPYCIVLAIVIYRSRNAAMRGEQKPAGGSNEPIPLTSLEKKAVPSSTADADGPPGLESPTKEEIAPLNESSPQKDKPEATSQGSPSAFVSVSAS